jgi:hypothetical protein
VVARIAGSTLLAAVAVGIAYLWLDDGDVSNRVLLLAGVVAWLAVRVALGKPLDPDEEQSEIPASFGTPVRILNEEPQARLETWTPPAQRPFVFPIAPTSAVAGPHTPSRSRGTTTRGPESVLPGS